MGAALTTPLIQNRHDVRLWGTEYDTALLSALRAGQPHPALDVQLQAGVHLFDPQALDEALDEVDMIVLAITSEGIGNIMPRILPHLQPELPLVMVTKGFNYDAQRHVTLISETLAAQLMHLHRHQNPIVAVGGPCKANEVAAGWPTATIYSSKNKQAAEQSRIIFQTATYRIDTTTDIVGLEVAATLKNVFAIALGICSGLEEQTGHPWHNLRAAIFAEAINEIARFADALGGQKETIYGLAGVGDLEVTALSGRNGTFGARIGRGEPAREVLAEIYNSRQTVEGVTATQLALAFVQQLAEAGKTHIKDYPLLKTLYTILHTKTNLAGTDLVPMLTEAAMPIPSQAS